MKNFTQLRLVVLALFLSLSGFTQDDASPEEYKKNVVHGEFGTWFLFIDGRVSYERIFKRVETSQGSVLYFGGQFGIGVTESFSYGTYGILSPNAFMLTGGKKSHMEMSLGMNFFLYDTFDNELANGSNVFSEYTPNIRIGYRWQNMNASRFVYRVGAGWPNGLYMGVGWNF